MDDLDRAKEIEMRDRQGAIDKQLSKPDRNPGETQQFENGVVVCIDCEEPIAKQRIASYPNSIRCVSCKEDWELRTK